ncbi:uncharacterized protein F54H12.2 [Trichonephila clavipes]|nr:uncharacterized protein F54H12.2 [Trichonephila clavipes]
MPEVCMPFHSKINVAASVVLAQAKALELGLIKMPIRRAEVRSFALSSGLQSSTIANAFIGQLPSRLNLGSSQTKLIMEIPRYNKLREKNAIEQKNDDGNSILYFRILNNSDIVKYLHTGKKDINYSYVYLHQSSLSEPYYIYQGANNFYKDLLQCIIDVKSTETKVPDSPSHRVKVGYLKILDADELLIDLRAPISRTYPDPLINKRDRFSPLFWIFSTKSFYHNTMNNDRKRMFDFTDNDEDDFLIAAKKQKRGCDKPKYDLDLSTIDGGAEKNTFLLML